MRTNSPRYFRVTAKVDIIPQSRGTPNEIYCELREIQEAVKWIKEKTSVKIALNREIELLRRYVKQLNTQKVTSCEHCDARDYSTQLCTHHRIN